MKVGRRPWYKGIMVALPSAPASPVIRFVVVELPTDDVEEPRPHPQLVREACSEVRSAVNRWMYERASEDVAPAWER